MKFIIIPIALWAVSQTVKFLIRLVHGESFSLSSASWIYLWASGAPSTHTALLTAMVWIAWRYDRFGPLFGLSFVVALLLIYDIALQRKWQLLLEHYFGASNDPVLRRLVRDGSLLDISGHSVIDIALGVLLGLVAGGVLTYFGVVP